MRTKTLLITAALAAAGLVSASAQVFSVNAVGYVNQTVPPGGYAVLSVPLNGNPNNDINTTIPLPNDGTYDGTSIYRFDPVTQGFRETMQWISGVGWLAAAPSDLIINPGEGFFLQNVGGVALNLTFVGEVPAGAALSNPLPGPNRYSIRSSLVPKGGRLGWEGLAGSLEFPAETGDSIYYFDTGLQRYRETYQYIDGVGWLHDVDPPEGPTVNPGTGFYIQKAGDATKTAWVQSFSVN